MTGHDFRPAVGVAHVVLETDRMEESAQFIRAVGMRPVFDGPRVSVYEMRGGTQLIPSPIESRSAIDHEVFTVREPAGHVIPFFSSHASGEPI